MDDHTQDAEPGAAASAVPGIAVEGERERERNDVAGLIRRVRRRARYSQRELAAELGVSQSAVAKWETGRRAPTALMLSRILGLGELRLVAVDAADRRVEAMTTQAAKDAGGRRYPAHTFVWAEGWWAPAGAEMTAWLGPIMRRSQELELPRVRYSRQWEAWRAQSAADLDDHPSWRELVAQAAGGWSPHRHTAVPIPEWALADSRRSRNRRPDEFRARACPLGRTG